MISGIHRQIDPGCARWASPPQSVLCHSGCTPSLAHPPATSLACTAACIVEMPVRSCKVTLSARMQYVG
eukprot:1156494-Pelagomonas_calceolata.AAC.4